MSEMSQLPPSSTSISAGSEFQKLGTFGHIETGKSIFLLLILTLISWTKMFSLSTKGFCFSGFSHSYVYICVAEYFVFCWDNQLTTRVWQIKTLKTAELEHRCVVVWSQLYQTSKCHRCHRVWGSYAKALKNITNWQPQTTWLHQPRISSSLHDRKVSHYCNDLCA